MKLKFKLKKRYIIIFSFLLAIFFLLFFLSSIIRWYIVKNGETLIGRKIDLKELHINYLSVSVQASEFVMYENNKQDTFVSFNELYINFDPWHLFKSTYAFSEIRLVKPTVSVVYSDTGFNFDNLIASSDTLNTDTLDALSTDTTKYLVKNISITGGYIRYTDNTAGNTTEIRELGINVPLISWNSSKAEMGIDFILGTDGKVTLGGHVNQSEGLYEVFLKTENIDMAPYMAYAAPYMDIASLNGRLYTDIQMSGDLNNPLNIKIFGSAGLNNLSITDANQMPFFTAANIHLILDSLDLGNNLYNIRTLRIEAPVVVAELDGKGTNFDRIFAPFFADTLGTDTVETDTVPLHYALDSIIITNGAVSFTDLTLNRPFSFNLSSLNYTITDFSDMAVTIPMSFDVLLNKTGSLSGKAVIDMLNTDNIFFDGRLAKLELQSFSPYTEYYLARPIIKGTFNYDCYLKMTPRTLDNKNNMRINGLKMGKKTKDTTAYKVPVGLALYVLKDRNDNILIDLPVSGDPSNPTFKLRRIIWKTLEEFLVKAATEPFNALGSMFGTSPESIKQIPFDWVQDTLLNPQIQKLEKLTEIIQKKGDLTFTFIQTTDPEKEKEMLALNYTKNLFAAQKLPQGSAADEVKRIAEETAVNSAEFLAFLGLTENGANDSLYIAAISKTGTEKTEALFNNLLLKREGLLRAYFTEKNIPAAAIAFKTADLRNIPVEMKKPMMIVEVTLQ